jgi:hypothetical protein
MVINSIKNKTSLVRAVSDCLAHYNNASVGSRSPLKTNNATYKLSDSIIRAIRNNSNYTGKTAYWLESEQWTNGQNKKNMFVSSLA